MVELWLDLKFFAVHTSLNFLSLSQVLDLLIGQVTSHMTIILFVPDDGHYFLIRLFVECNVRLLAEISGVKLELESGVPCLVITFIKTMLRLLVLIDISLFFHN